MKIIAALVALSLMACTLSPAEPGKDGAPGPAGEQGAPGPGGEPCSMSAPAAKPSVVHRMHQNTRIVQYTGPGYPAGSAYPAITIDCPEGAPLLSGSCESNEPLILDRPNGPGGGIATGWACQVAPESAPREVFLSVLVVCIEAQ